MVSYLCHILVDGLISVSTSGTLGKHLTVAESSLSDWEHRGMISYKIHGTLASDDLDNTQEPKNRKNDQSQKMWSWAAEMSESEDDASGGTGLVKVDTSNIHIHH